MTRLTPFNICITTRYLKKFGFDYSRLAIKFYCDEFMHKHKTFVKLFPGKSTRIAQSVLSMQINDYSYPSKKRKRDFSNINNLENIVAFHYN